MTLREEIKNRIEIIQYADTEQIYPDEETDQILKLFEKLIDENKEKSNMLTYPSKNNPNYLYLKGRIFGRKEAIEELKEELEK